MKPVASSQSRGRLVGTNKFLRYQNSKGQVIPLHHAFRTIELSSVSRVSAIVLPIFFMAILWLFLHFIMELWAHIFNFWMTRIFHWPTGSNQVTFEPEIILGLRIFVPYPLLEAELPSTTLVWSNLIVCTLGFLVSFLVSSRSMPFTYLTRTILTIQASASVDRIVTDIFPYTLKIYMIDSLMVSIYMLFVLPALLGMVYYIFDFSLARKFWLTTMMIIYYLFFIPCQYMLHAYIIYQYSLLFMPLLYMFFGVLPDVLAFVSIYAYGMSWRSNITANQGRGA